VAGAGLGQQLALAGLYRFRRQLPIACSPPLASLDAAARPKVPAAPPVPSRCMNGFLNPTPGADRGSGRRDR
jgi:hypothetical protein